MFNLKDIYHWLVNERGQGVMTPFDLDPYRDNRRTILIQGGSGGVSWYWGVRNPTLSLWEGGGGVRVGGGVNIPNLEAKEPVIMLQGGFI